MTSRLLTAPPIRPTYLLKARQYSLNLESKTLIMGVVNLTPDSFSQDGCLSKNHNPSKNVLFAKKLIAQGADIIDLGAESSRPGAGRVSAKEERRRLMPTLLRLTRSVDVPISIDTYKSEVAQEALDAGASIINNIKGTQLNNSLLRMVRDYKAAIILMHMRGNSRNMQKKTSYKNLMKEIKEDLKGSLEKCLDIGIKKDRIILDPGLGFAKTVEQNLEILRELNQLCVLNCPLLIGPSRKSFIGQVLGNKPPDKRLMGTAAAVSLSIALGASIVRVHDVADIKDVALVADAIINH